MCRRIILKENNCFLPHHTSELESLFSEHFGRTPSATPCASQLSDSSDQDDDESSDDIEKEPDLDLRARQFLHELETEHVYESGESENELQYEDTTIAQDDPDLVKVRRFKADGCGCKRECQKLFQTTDIVKHILNIREMEKQSKEMYIMSTLVDNADKENTKKGTKRKRARHEFMFLGKQVCKKLFMLVFDIGKHSLQNIMTHVNQNGVVPRSHGNAGRKPSKSLVFDDIKRVVQYISNYADEYGMPQPAAPRGRDNTAPIYLTSETTKKSMHEKYVDTCMQLVPPRRFVKYSTFCNIWTNCLSFIRIASPRDDVCATCEKMRKAIVDSITEDEKLESTTCMKNHIIEAQKERDIYNACIKLAKESHLNDNIEQYIHYTFDFCQNVCIPHHSRQMGPLYFITLRKIQIFGFRIDGIPKQMNFLIDENETIGRDGKSTHGPNAVISMIDYAMDTYGSGETTCTIHADNCPELEPYMEKWFSTVVFQGIQWDMMNYGPSYAVTSFLDAVKKRPNTFPKWMAALRHTGQIAVYNKFIKEVRKHFNKTRPDKFHEICTLIAAEEKELLDEPEDDHESHIQSSSDKSISSLKANVYNMLGKALEKTNENGDDQEPWWNHIINNGDLNVSRKEQRQIEKCNNPGREFLDILDERDYTLGDLQRLFEQFRMNEALDILSGHQNKDVVVPDELASDPRTLELYQTAVREGKERDRNIRVMIVGCYGQGKSSLVRQLTGQSLEGVESTDGIEVLICESILDKQEVWTIKYLGDARAESMKRLATVARLIQNQPLETTGHTTNPVSYSNSNTQKTTTGNDELAHQIDEIESKSEMEVDVQTLYSRVPTMDSLDFVKEIENDKRKENKLQEKNLEINIWDFGGQFVYYATHQLFHSRQAIYILVFDIAKGLDVNIYDKECPNKDKKKSLEEYLKFWIGSIHSFVGNEEGTEPPIFLVGTHLDMLDEHIDRDERFEDVRKLFDDTLCASHIQDKDFAVSNTNPNHATFAEIRRTITAYALKKSASLFIPAKWIPLERSLKENRHLKIITFEKVKEFDRSNDIPIASEDQLKLFLHYHHEKGTFFYFENENDVINHIVLDPQFLIDAFRCIITANKFCSVHQNLRKLWQKLCNEAVLEKELLDELWKKESDKEFMKFKKPLLFFLQKQRIIAEALAFDEASSTTVPLNFYIVPSLLKITSEGMIDDFLKEKRYTKVSIGYSFKYVSTLCTVYNRVIAAALGKWPVLKFKSTSLVYENDVVCKLNLSHSGILKRQKNSLELVVVSLCPEEDVCKKDCDAFRRFVEMVIKEELHKFQAKDFEQQRRGYSEIVRCYDKDHGYSGSCETYELDTLQSYDKDIIGCPDHFSHSINIKDIRTEWFNADILDADVPKRILSEKELSKLSANIGKDWEQLARMLGFSDAVIEQVVIDKNTTAARIYEILKRWRAEQLDHATLDILINAIRNCGSLTVDRDALKNLIDGPV